MARRPVRAGGERGDGLVGAVAGRLNRRSATCCTPPHWVNSAGNRQRRTVTATGLVLALTRKHDLHQWLVCSNPRTLCRVKEVGTSEQRRRRSHEPIREGRA